MSMRATVLLTLIVAQLIWWDLLDKVRVAIRWDWARSVIDREVADRARRLFAIARLLVGLVYHAELDESQVPSRFMVVSNHQSLIDIGAIMAAFRRHSVRFVAKRELERGFPAVSGVLRIQRHALISRHGDFADAMRRIERLGRTLRRNEGAVIFPEGTRSRDGDVHTFHSGAVRRLTAANPLPMVVLAVDGGWNVARLADLARIRRGHVYRLKMVSVLPAATTKRELIAQVSKAQQSIAGEIHRLRANEEARPYAR